MWVVKPLLSFSRYEIRWFWWQCGGRDLSMSLVSLASLLVDGIER